MSRSLLLALVVVAASVPVAPPSARAAETAATAIAAGDEALVKFDLTKATTAYKSALKLDGKNHDACWRLARALVDQSMLETDDAKKKLLLLEAQDYARWSVRLDANDPKGHTFLAIVVGKLALYYGGRTKVELSKEVKSEAEKAIALDSKEDLAYHVLGVWNREMVELNWFLKKFAEVLYGAFPPASMDNALKNLRHAGELAPQIVPHQVELGITLAAAGKWDESKRTLEAALAMPKTWITDDVYKEQTRKTLETVKRHAQ